MKRSQARSDEAIEFARSQRRTANQFASTVWQWIRNRQVDNVKFRREFPIPPYTVDFCSVERKLIIEVDGESHFTEEGQQHDQIRDRFLRELGYRVLRINGYDLLRDDSTVIETIREFIESSGNANCPSPLTPLPEAGRGEKDLT
jgi:very-short-patch-repair endonuclease